MLSPSRLLSVALAAVAVAYVPAQPVVARAQAAQQPTFRSAVDLVAVDVQVVDRAGNPVLGLTPDSFEVTIDGRKRQVISAELLKYAPANAAASVSVDTGPRARNDWPVADATGPGRTFIVVVDVASFPMAESVGVVRAAQAFIDRLSPGDQVGVFTIPRGAALSPTTDRTAVRQTLSKVVGIQGLMTSRYHLTPAEVIDIASDDNTLETPATRGTSTPSQSDTLRQVTSRECRTATDQVCARGIFMEADGMSRQFEQQVTESLAGLNGLLRQLFDYPGRKTVVLLSAGMPVHDGKGGWHNDGSGGRALGHEAARAQATVYAIHVDQGYRASSAEQRLSRSSISAAREREVQQVLLNEFAVSSGGALFTVATGSGELGLDRLMLETSAYYMLGVSPAMLDLDGQTHRLKVKVVKGPGATTIRNRQFVLLQPSR